MTHHRYMTLMTFKWRHLLIVKMIAEHWFAEFECHSYHLKALSLIDINIIKKAFATYEGRYHSKIFSSQFPDVRGSLSVSSLAKYVLVYNRLQIIERFLNKHAFVCSYVFYARKKFRARSWNSFHHDVL